MPIDVRMPDGTLVKNVPDNITQAELLAKYNANMAQPATPVTNPTVGPEGAPIPSILQNKEPPVPEQTILQKLVGVEPTRGPKGPGAKELASDIYAAAKQFPEQLASSAIQAYQGKDIEAIADQESTANKIINDARKTAEANMAIKGAEDTYTDFLGAKIKRSDIRNLPQNLSFSLVAMGSALLSGLGATIASAPVAGPASPLVGTGAGAAAAGKVAYNIDTNSFLRDVREGLNQASIEQRGIPITNEEFVKIAQSPEMQAKAKEFNLDVKGKGAIDELARIHGLHEAGWEAISSMVGIGAGKYIFKEALKGKILKPVAAFTGELGLELTGESATQLGQSNVERKAGMHQDAERSWSSAEDWKKSYEEVAGPTLLATTVLGGAPAAVGAAKRAITKATERPAPQERVEPEITEPPVPGAEVPTTQAPVQPVKAETSHDTQAMLDELSGKDIEYIPEEEIKPIEITKKPISNAKDLVKDLGGESAQQLRDDFNPTYNYTNKDGVEVTFKEEGKVFNLVPGDEDTQVGSDIHLDYIGSKDRNKGLASKELDRIINKADENNLSISLEVDKQDKDGLTNDQLKNWYGRKGFVFPRGSDIGYRPRPDEALTGYPEKTIQVPSGKIQDVEQQINSDLTGRTFSDEETFYEVFNSGNLKEGYQMVPTDLGDEIYYYDGKNKPTRVDGLLGNYDTQSNKVLINQSKLLAEPTGIISETEKEFTPVGGRLINKKDVDRLARESAIALQQNLATQEAEKQKQLKQEAREEKFREPPTQTLSARLVQVGGISRAQKRDMLGETGKIEGYDHVFRETGGDLLTLVKDGKLDDYLPPDIRSTATPPDGLFDARPGYNYISDLIKTGEKIHTYDYEMAKLQHENMVYEKNLAKQQMTPNEAARAAAAEIQNKIFLSEGAIKGGTTPELADAIIRRLLGKEGRKLLDDKKLRLVGSANGLDTRLLKQITNNTRAFYDPVTNTSYIITDRVLPNELKPMILHEVGVHYGMRRMLGDVAYKNLLATIEKLHKTDAAVNEAWNTVLQTESYAKLLETEETKPAFLEEVLAHLGESAPNHSLWKRIVQAVKTFLIKNNIIKDLSSDEIKDLVTASLKHAAYEKIDPSKIILSDKEKGLEARLQQTNSKEFKDWFGNSKVVDEKGNPKVMYHGTKQDIDEFKSAYQIAKEKDDRYGGYGLAGIYFTPDPSFASMYAKTDFRKRKEQANVLPVYLRMEKPYIYPKGKWAQFKAAFLNPIERLKYNRAVRKNIEEKGFPDSENIKSMQISKEGYRFVRIQEVNKLKAQGYDGIVSPDGQMYIVFEPNQIKSAIGNRGTFDSSTNILSSQRPPRNIKGQEVLPQWHGPEESKTDEWIYRLQNKQIDTKRVQELIGDIDDNWNVYEKEQLYHGRTASGIRNFLLKELLPVIKEIERLKINTDEIRTYLHNRHAEERNNQMNKINPDIYDETTGRTIPNPLKDKGSGISTADARAYLAGLDPARKQMLEQIATKFDEMIRGTQRILINSGAESKDTINKWNKTYKHYVPLFRVEDEMARPSGLGGTGQGFAVSGPSSKRAMGSEKDVQDILSNIIAQRERALIRAEKIRVGRALYGLAIQNPNPDFWLPINPDAMRNKKQAASELTRMGIRDAKDVVDNLMAEPKERYLKKIRPTEEGVEPDENFDFDSGLPVNQSKEVVASKVNVMSRYKDFVFPVRINGKDRYIFFNKNDPRALRMVQSLKNLDVENLGWALGVAGKFTRWFKNVNTQYNPVFGLVNFVRDFGGALLNLTNTEIAGEQAKVIAGAYKAMGGILNVHRAERKGAPLPTGPWAKLYQEARAEGFQTGYRDSLIRNQEEMQIIEHTLEQFKDSNTKKAFYAVIGGLTDFNDMMENAIRLSAYKAARDKGLSKQKAAIIAKNLTVNFDKKGAWTAQVNALYAFFNASVQGTERIYRTITGPKGKMIIGGGILAGMIQAIMIASAGYGDDDPPEFVREKNFIIPLPDGTYLTIPYPLGFNVLPNSGRIIMDFMLHGGRDPGKHAVSLLASTVNAFNPLGSTGLSFQTLAPTIADPLVALGENKDAFGRPIARKDRATAPTPGYTRSRDTATRLSQGIAYFLNLASGGSKYQKGYISPTADELDFIAGQVGGGLYREVTKAGKAVSSLFTGEEIPTYQRPVVGRFVGKTGSQAAISQTFYDNITRMTDHENEVKGRLKNQENVEAYFQDYPEARLWKRANTVENKINELNKRKRLFIERGYPKERIQAIDAQKATMMQRFNDQYDRARAD